MALRIEVVALALQASQSTTQAGSWEASVQSQGCWLRSAPFPTRSLGWNCHQWSPLTHSNSFFPLEDAFAFQKPRGGENTLTDKEARCLRICYSLLLEPSSLAGPTSKLPLILKVMGNDWPLGGDFRPPPPGSLEQSYSDSARGRVSFNAQFMAKISTPSHSSRGQQAL